MIDYLTFFQVFKTPLPYNLPPGGKDYCKSFSPLGETGKGVIKHK
jgi:hypothetical protein